jgi:Aminoglycoside-2''-adenylyltransferase
VSEQLPGGGIELSPAAIEALGARWSSCWTPRDVARHLAGIAAPWYVAAGWALDLFRGRQTREHGDILPQTASSCHAQACVETGPAGR